MHDTPSASELELAVLQTLRCLLEVSVIEAGWGREGEGDYWWRSEDPGEGLGAGTLYT